MRTAFATLLATVVLGCAPAVAGAVGTIEGTVTAQGGKPVAGGSVWAYLGENWLRDVGSIAADGSYKLTLPAGQYSVFFQPPYTGGGNRPLGEELVGYYPGGSDGKTAFREDATPISVADGATTTLNGHFPLEAVLTGRGGLFPDGSAADSMVFAYNSDGRRYVGSGDMTGYEPDLGPRVWALRNLLSGKVRVLFASSYPDFPESCTSVPCHVFMAYYDVESQFFDRRYSLAGADEITVSAGEITPRLDAPALTRAGHILGTITRPDGSPLKGARVYARRSDGRRAGPFVSDFEGKYLAFGLRAGDWSLWFGPPNSNYLGEYHSDGATLAGSTPVAVAGHARITVNASLARAGHIEGLVTDEARGSIPGVKVSVYNGFDQVVGSATTGANGQYRIGGLRTNVYRVGFEPPAGSGFRAEFWNDKAQLADADGVWVMAGSTVPAIDAELALD